jgi:aryl-alcohol dehydrogenase-like predicted oxidoreductase
VHEGARESTVQRGKEAQVSMVLDRIAKRKGTAITSVALAYVMHKGVCDRRLSPSDTDAPSLS